MVFFAFNLLWSTAEGWESLTLYGGGGGGVSVGVWGGGVASVCVSKGKFGQSRTLARTQRHMTGLVTDLT